MTPIVSARIFIRPILALPRNQGNPISPLLAYPVEVSQGQTSR